LLGINDSYGVNKHALSDFHKVSRAEGPR
jgi:hypothetical protein